jgi:hypothetical protein
MFNYFFFRKSCTLWDKQGRAGHATDENNDACAMHAGYLSLQLHPQSIAFPLQLWSHEPSSMLRYTVRTLPFFLDTSRTAILT